jgi:hypothetical protein
MVAVGHRVNSEQESDRKSSRRRKQRKEKDSPDDRNTMVSGQHKNKAPREKQVTIGRGRLSSEGPEGRRKRRGFRFSSCFLKSFLTLECLDLRLFGELWMLYPTSS